MTLGCCWWQWKRWAFFRNKNAWCLQLRISNFETFMRWVSMIPWWMPFFHQPQMVDGGCLFSDKPTEDDVFGREWRQEVEFLFWGGTKVQHVASPERIFDLGVKCSWKNHGKTHFMFSWSQKVFHSLAFQCWWKQLPGIPGISAAMVTWISNWKDLHSQQTQQGWRFSMATSLWFSDFPLKNPVASPISQVRSHGRRQVVQQSRAPHRCALAGRHLGTRRFMGIRNS